MRTAFAAGLGLALLVSACGGSDSPFATAPTTTVAATTTGITTTTAAATTITAATTTTTTQATTTTTTTAPTTTTTTTTAPPPMDCPGAGAGPVPADATEVSSKPAQLDGDGLADTFTAYLRGETWYLQATLGTGFTARLALDAAWAAAYHPTGTRNVRVDGAFNLGVPTNQAVSVRLYTGLGIAYGLFTLEDCGIVPFLGEDGTLPGLWQGMGANHSDWPVCGPGRTVLQVTFASATGCSQVSDCPNPDISIQEYRVTRDPARLLFQGEESRASTHAEFADMVSRSCIGG